MVIIKRCKYGYLIKDLCEEDINKLKNYLSITPRSLTFDPESFFIKKINKLGMYNEKGKRIKQIPNEVHAKIKIKLLGFKESTQGSVSPILHVEEVNICKIEFESDDEH